MNNLFDNSVYICIAPHPDDETLGCGGLLLRAKALGAKIYWVIITEVKGSSAEAIEFRERRTAEISNVSKSFDFDGVYELKYESAGLCTVSQLDLIPKLAKIIDETRCTHLLAPYRNDIHSDHKYVHDAALSASKSFRATSIAEILLYETLSETDFSLRYDDPGFKPNLLVNIEEYLDENIKILSLYKSNSSMPFPRGKVAVKALATLRGVQSKLLSCRSVSFFKENYTMNNPVIFF